MLCIFYFHGTIKKELMNVSYYVVIQCIYILIMSRMIFYAFTTFMHSQSIKDVLVDLSCESIS